MFRRVLLGLALAGMVVGLHTLLRPREPDPALIRLAVRATLYAMPTATPYVVEVTRAVEVTRVPETATTAAPSPSATPAPTVAPAQPRPEGPRPTATVATAGPARQVRLKSPLLSPPPAHPRAGGDRPEGSRQEAVAVISASDPTDRSPSSTCPNSSDNTYTLIPVSGAPIDHPDQLHGDLNLSLRGYVPASAAPVLVDIPGPVDSDPPQLGALMPDGSATAFTRTYRVHDWNWSCGEHGCRGGELGGTEISLLGIAATPGMPVSIPSRQAQIYGGGFVALVVYADTTRLTLVYTREDSVANGYAVHLENVCVDAALLATYRSANQSGRSSLPAVRNGQIIGIAAGEELAVAVRDRGSFADPRSRKDWWQSGN